MDLSAVHRMSSSGLRRRRDALIAANERGLGAECRCIGMQAGRRLAGACRGRAGAVRSLVAQVAWRWSALPGLPWGGGAGRGGGGWPLIGRGGLCRLVETEQQAVPGLVAPVAGLAGEVVEG